MTTIVVGAAGTARSEDAVSFAAHLARETGARLVLVCAHPGPPFVDGVEDLRVRDSLRAEAEATLARMRGRADGGSGVVTLAVEDPSPARALQQVARRERAALIVVGSSHVGRLGRVLPGATAERLLHGAPCPVVIVPAGSAHGTDHRAKPVGAAYDGSPEARIALDAAVAAARALRAPLHVIGVCDVGRYTAPALQYGPGYFVGADTVRENAATQLAAAIAELPADVEATQVLRVGVPARELVDASSGLAMLFVGSRGYGPLRAVLLGGVGGALVRDAACPVIVTPRGAHVDRDVTTAAAAETIR